MSIFELGSQRSSQLCLSVPTHAIDSLPTSLSARITNPRTGERRSDPGLTRARGL